MTVGIRSGVLLVAALLAAAADRPSSAQSDARDDALWRHRNLGKAFYENPTTHVQAVEELKRALDLAPASPRERINYGLALLRAGRTEEGVAELERVQKEAPQIPHTWFNLGIAYKRGGDERRAIEQFETMIRLVPSEPASHYNLGALYKLTGDNGRAVEHLEQAARLNPRLAAPHFQLYNIYRDPAVGRVADAERERQLFDALKKQQAGAAVPEDLEWSYYAELYDDPPAAAADAHPLASIRFVPAIVERGIDALTAGLAALDADGDGRPDLLVWSANGIHLLRSGVEEVADAGLGDLRDVVAVAPGDFDNDGLPDLAVVLRDGVALYRNRGGTFVPQPTALPAGRFARAVWLDYDHDYDLDLFLIGERPAVLRNNGSAGFADRSADFPFVEGRAIDAAAIQIVPDTPGLDLVVTYADRVGVVYRDRLGGRFDAESLDAVPPKATGLIVADVDRDGAFDLAFTASGKRVIARNENGRFHPRSIDGGSPAAPFAFIDFDRRGALDVATGSTCYRQRDPESFIAAACDVPSATAIVAADFDGDGRTDLAAVAADGTVRLLRNDTGADGQSLRVRLVGVKNPKLAAGAVIEVKSGARYQKAMYEGVPIAFGLGATGAADAVRITWPNGLIQNEIAPRQSDATYKEAQRLSGSCPLIFTRKGSRFEFITDVLGVAPLGASAGDGRYFTVDHDEYVHIPAGALLPLDGSLEVRVTEELHEVSFIDQLKLFALDHPSAIDIVTNEKFKSPPYPDFRLFGTDHPIAPLRATDDHGRDLRDRLARRDGVYVDDFARDAAGAAARHHLDLDFGKAAPGNHAVLVLNGWVDWADGSTFRAAWQERPDGLAMPFLQVKDSAGSWRTVVEDMGLPAGKPKTIAVDLTGKFLSSSREVRIVTDLCVYWDQAYLLDTADTPPIVLTPLAVRDAALRFRGFSHASIDPARQKPELFDYDPSQPTSIWNPTPGLYTRYGDVRSLITDVDDRFVIMGSGDEIAVRFDGTRIPPLRAGWTRDYLLLVDGWAKDADANTAFSQTVEPLPFHAMSAYPYPSTEHFPVDDAHRTYRSEYNSRPALRLLRPLHDIAADSMPRRIRGESE